jgi:hypothetical protein
MRPFDRLYFDTQILMRERWPHPSPSTTKLSQVAAELGVSLCLPEGVDIELEENWLREANDRYKSALLYISGVVDTGRVVLSEPDWEEVRRDYRSTVENAKTRLKLSVVRLTPHALADIFRLSARRDAPFHPFQNEDRRIGLQDAAIYLSVVEDLRSRRETGAFLTDDNIFEDKGLAELTTIGVNLRRFKDFESIQKALEQGLDETRKRRLREDQHRAIQALEQRNAELERHINEHFKPQYSYWYVSGTGNVVEISRIEVVKVQEVQTPYPPITDSHDRIEISAEVSALFHTRVEESLSVLAIPPQEMGSEIPVVTSRPPKYTFTGIAMPTLEYLLSGTISVQATAIVKGGQYQEIEFGTVGEAKNLRAIRREA